MVLITVHDTYIFEEDGVGGVDGAVQRTVDTVKIIISRRKKILAAGKACKDTS